MESLHSFIRIKVPNWDRHPHNLLVSADGIPKFLLCVERLRKIVIKDCKPLQAAVF
jgi:hypothetical protein